MAVCVLSDNLDLLYISDFSLPIMRTLPAHLARASVPLSLYRLDSLIEIQRNMPQQECPLVSEGRKAHHEEDHHEEDHHEEDHHEEDGPKEDHNEMIHKDKSGSFLVKDFQTENKSYYTLARDHPHSFAREGNKIQMRNT